MQTPIIHPHQECVCVICGSGARKKWLVKITKAHKLDELETQAKNWEKLKAVLPETHTYFLFTQVLVGSIYILLILLKVMYHINYDIKMYFF